MKIQTSKNRRRFVGSGLTLRPHFPHLLVDCHSASALLKHLNMAGLKKSEGGYWHISAIRFRRRKSSNNLVFRWTVCDVTAEAFHRWHPISPHQSSWEDHVTFGQKPLEITSLKATESRTIYSFLIIQSAHHRPTSRVSLLHVVWSYVSKQRIICLTLFSLSKRHLLTCDSSQMPQLSVVVAPNLSICLKKKKNCIYQLGATTEVFIFSFSQIWFSEVDQ